MNTFIDPDRYELFHSSQSVDPGLNIASYIGSAETIQVKESQLERLPRIDRLLEVTRTFDPLQAKSERLRNYLDIQTLIAEDAPVVFLYHPQFIYYANTNVSHVDLSNVASVEDRFRNIENWEIK
ncbi:hypothetical protein IH575_02270, partial [Candidatus Dojkabacteria bacterium]|nr:hypothetical protein [Candidatus Dojkabacteria bacterium]